MSRFLASTFVLLLLLPGAALAQTKAKSAKSCPEFLTSRFLIF